MKQTEFIRIVNLLGYGVHESYKGHALFIHSLLNDGKQHNNVATVSEVVERTMNVDYEEVPSSELFSVLYEYAKTSISER